jgi:type II secretory pathway pseudopilin PulG
MKFAHRKRSSSRKSRDGEGTTDGGALTNRRYTEAFTLAEVLAALVFMAILIPVALEGLSIAGRAGEVAARKNMAAIVADSVLNETVITTNYARSLQNGTVRQGNQDFRWTLRNEPWNKDPNAITIRLLSVEVTYTAQGRDYSVRLSTLVDTTAPTDQTTTGTQQ